MARSRSLFQLRSDIRWQADLAGLTLRHTDAAINRIINQAAHRLRELISDNGLPYYLLAKTGTCPVGATSPYAFGVIDVSAFPQSVVRIYGVDITVDGEVLSLDPVAFGERNSFQNYLRGTENGIPQAFTTYDNNHIALLPPAQTAYPYAIWYLPVMTDLSIDDDTFNGIVGWEDWIVWECMTRLVVRDERTTAFQLAVSERDRFERDMLKNARKLQRAGAIIKRDTRKERRRRQIFTRRNGWLA